VRRHGNIFVIPDDLAGVIDSRNSCRCRAGDVHLGKAERTIGK